MKDTLTLIKDKRTELSELHKRMDSTIGILTLPYVLKGFAEQLKEQPIPNSVSVTLNKASNYADYFVSTLASMTRQPVVEGKAPTINHDVEEFATDLLYTMGEKQRLRQRGTPEIWLADQVSKRGPIGYKLLFDKEGNLKPKPVDMRWACWQEKGEGYDWISYQMTRDAESVRREYEGVKGANIKLIPDGKDLDINEWWNNERWELWAGDKKFLEQENTLGFLPFCLEFPLVGTFIEDKGYLKWRYDDIFGLNRLLYPEWNRLASILQTMGVAVLYPALAEVIPDGQALVGGPYPYPGMVKPIRTGQEVKAVFTPEITKAFMTALKNISQALQEGGVSDAEFGETNPDVTGIRYTQISSVRARRMKPRIDAISQMYSGLVKLAMRELRQLKIKPKLGTNKKEYNNLPDPDELNISFRLMPDDKVMEVVRLMQGKGMDGFLSKQDIYKDILHHEDPDGALTNLYIEQAVLSDPITRYRELSRRAREKAKKLTGEEKKDMIQNALYWADMMERAMQQQSTAQQGVEQPKGQGQALQSVTGMMGKGGSGRKAASQEVI